MTYDEMNIFIQNYVEYDKTGRAVMLNGPWGSGKSYYVKNHLKKFLEDNENGKHKCVIVSLYGLSDVSEISKAIYVELRSIVKLPESEIVTTATTISKVIGKTVFNGLISKIGFDIGNVNDEEFENVYKSIDLSGKLIILEDIERTQIDILELLGYVNNLCENDGVKVLLVANENELLKFHMETEEITQYGRTKTRHKKVYDEDAQKYIRAKEKTISDTLNFNCDYVTTIDSIVDSFENDDLSKAKEYLKYNRRNSVYGTVVNNFREVIVACQKACDIFRFMQINSISAEDDFKISVTVGLVFYLQKKLSDSELKFKSNTLFDSNLSNNDMYPLFKFCYDYYNEQIIDETTINNTIEEYKEYLIYVDKTSVNDKDLKYIYSFYTSTEIEINSAINNIYYRLNDINDIGLKHYDRIVNSLIILKYDILLENDKIELIIEKIINNLEGRGEHFKEKNHLFTCTTFIESESGKQKFEEVKKKIYDALNKNEKSQLSFFQSNIFEYISKISDNVRLVPPNKLFEILDLEVVYNHITKFAATNIDELRHIFLNINYYELNEESISKTLDFKSNLEVLIKQDEIGLDKIQINQIKWTIRAIDTGLALLKDK